MSGFLRGLAVASMQRTFQENYWQERKKKEKRQTMHLEFSSERERGGDKLWHPWNALTLEDLDSFLAEDIAFRLRHKC